MTQRKSSLMVSRKAILHNAQAVRRLTTKRMIAVIKENGYGIGLENLYRILYSSGIDFFAVGAAWEAMKLRQLGFEGEILLLTPEYSPEICRQLMQEHVLFMLGNPCQAEVLQKACQGTTLCPRVHLKIDTGLGRYGFSWKSLSGAIYCTVNMEVEGVYTHFSSTGKDFRSTIRLQKERFDSALQELAKHHIPLRFLHASASRTLAELGDLGYDGVRVGSLFLGRETANHSDFRDAVWLETAICDRKWYPAGELVGYGRTVKLKRDTLLGVAAAGCGDGLGISRSRQGTLPLLRQAVQQALYPRTTCASTVNGRSIPILESQGVSHTLLDLTDTPLSIGSLVRFPINPLLLSSSVNRIIC